MTNAVHDAVTHHYVIHGYGNSINVQARLAQRGHVLSCRVGSRPAQLAADLR